MKENYTQHIYLKEHFHSHESSRISFRMFAQESFQNKLSSNTTLRLHHVRFFTLNVITSFRNVLHTILRAQYNKTSIQKQEKYIPNKTCLGFSNLGIVIFTLLLFQFKLNVYKNFKLLHFSRIEINQPSQAIVLGICMSSLKTETNLAFCF